MDAREGLMPLLPDLHAPLGVGIPLVPLSAVRVPE